MKKAILAGITLTAALSANTVTFYSGPGDTNNSGQITVQTGPGYFSGGYTETVPGVADLCGNCETGEVLHFTVLDGLVSAIVRTIADQGTAVQVNEDYWLQEFNVGSGPTEFMVPVNELPAGDATLEWFSYGPGERSASVELKYETPTIAPEPGTTLLLGIGMIAVGLPVSQRRGRMPKIAVCLKDFPAGTGYYTAGDLLLLRWWLFRLWGGTANSASPFLPNRGCRSETIVREIWINEYSNGCRWSYNSKGEADSDRQGVRIACVKVSYSFSRGEGIPHA